MFDPKEKKDPMNHVTNSGAQFKELVDQLFYSQPADEDHGEHEDDHPDE
jgi:hypothetical protein